MRVGSGRRRRDGPARLVEALAVDLGQVEALAGNVAIDELLVVEGGSAAVVGRLQMGAHKGRTGQAVARGPGLSRDFEAAMLDEALEGAPDRRRTRFRGDMTPYGFASGARVVCDVVENVLVGERHGTKLTMS